MDMGKVGHPDALAGVVWSQLAPYCQQHVSDRSAGAVVMSQSPSVPESIVPAESCHPVSPIDAGEYQGHSYHHDKAKITARLKRIEGQVRGISRMVDEEQYCIDILTQVSAMTRALQSVALGLLDEHLSHCVVRAAAEGGAEADIKIEEASNAIARLVRS
jgi:DNA-binding FrmR family transcriptional regulator